MPDQPAETLADQLARRIAERDNPAPPPPPSQEPAAVAARLDRWLLTTHQRRHRQGRLRLTRMLLALLVAPRLSSAALAEAAGQPRRAAGRTLDRLYTLGLTDQEYVGLVRYHWLTPAAEDALLPVVRGS